MNTSRKLRPEQAHNRDFRAFVPGHRPEKGLYWEVSYRNADKGWWVYRPVQPDENGKRLRTRISSNLADFGKPWFQEAVRAAKYGRQGQAVPGPIKAVKVARNDPNSLQWLIDAYLAWMAPKTGKGFQPATKKQHRTILTHLGKQPYGAYPFRMISSKNIIDIRDGFVERGATAQGQRTLSVIEQLYKWAGSSEAEKALGGNLVKINPCAGVAKIDRSNDVEDRHVWTPGEQKMFKDAFGFGTRERIAYELMRTGMACVDACRVGPKDMFTTPKGELMIASKRQKTGNGFSVPVTPGLKAAIDAGPCGKTTFLGAEKTGEELDAGYVSGWIARTCDEIGIPDCTAHGLRHTAITGVLEKGGGVEKIMGHFGVSLLRAHGYVKTFNAKKVTEGSAHLFESDAA